MLRILHGTSYDFIKYWKHAAIATVVFIVAGMGLLLVHHARTGSAVNWNVEFTGGTFMQVSFKNKPDPAAVRAAVGAAGFNDAEVAAFGSDTSFSIKASIAGQTATVRSADSTAAQIEAALHQKFGDSAQVKVVDAQFVGAKVGDELKRDATIAILISFLVTLIYLAIRFEWRFGLAAVVATAHDVLTTLAFIAMLRLEVSLTVVAAILTVIGYSLNEAVVVFDRIRENFAGSSAGDSRRFLVNRSIAQVLRRSIFTAFTVITGSICLYEYGAEPLQMFSLAIGLGLACGSVASLFIAPNLLLLLQPTQSQLASPVRARAATALGEGGPS